MRSADLPSPAVVVGIDGSQAAISAARGPSTRPSVETSRCGSCTRSNRTTDPATNATYKKRHANSPAPRSLCGPR